MRSAAFLALAVLGAACTGDRPASRPEAAASAADERPVCRASPGTLPEGFLLTRTREIRYRDHVGVREEYRHDNGRLLVYLLGVVGEMGEGAGVARDVQLSTGMRATLFGSPQHEAWSLVWRGEPPCPQIAIVGNRFTRVAFTDAMRDAGVLAGPA